MTDDVVVLDDPVHKEEVAHFHAPAIQHNPDGWGPCELPDQFKDIPYQPFSKGDRLGKVSHNVDRCSLAPRTQLFASSSTRTAIVVLISFTFLVDLRLDRAGLPGQKVSKYVCRLFYDSLVFDVIWCVSDKELCNIYWKRNKQGFAQ